MRAERIYLDITKDRIIVVERALHSSFSPIIKISRIDDYKFADRILALSQTDITTSDVSHGDEGSRTFYVKLALYYPRYKRGKQIFSSLLFNFRNEAFGLRDKTLYIAYFLFDISQSFNFYVL